MMEQPTKYAFDEGGPWKDYPFVFFPVTNPVLMAHKPVKLDGKTARVLIKGIYKGSAIAVHSFLWDDGSRWDALNGMTDGELPR